MKKVSGSMYVRALGEHNFEFYVPDDTTKEQIDELVDKACNYSIDYVVEDGYEEYTVVKYRKKQPEYKF